MVASKDQEMFWWGKLQRREKYMLEICFFVISKIEEHVLCGEEGEEEKDVTERISKTVN